MKRIVEKIVAMKGRGNASHQPVALIVFVERFVQLLIGLVTLTLLSTTYFLWRFSFPFLVRTAFLWAGCLCAFEQSFY